MLTRKRAREIGDRPKSCGFDPIMESCAQFLELQDCGSVAQLNKRFHRVFWIYILRSSYHDKPAISVDKTSFMWVKKYATELKSHSLVINQYCLGVDLVLLGVNFVHSLEVRNFIRIPELPIELRRLHLYNCEIYHLPKFPPIKECSISCTFSSDVENLLTKLPQTLERLTILNDFANLTMLPFLPNLTSLETSVGILTKSMRLKTQCPTLSTVILAHRVVSVECLRGVKLQRLIIKTLWALDLKPLWDSSIDELDLTECPHAIGLSKFPNVKTIKT
jgi:hypothetical protein